MFLEKQIKINRLVIKCFKFSYINSYLVNKFKKEENKYFF